MPAPVTLILLNWNGWQDTLVCLETLDSLCWPSLRIIVVDNGSSDDSVQQLRHQRPDVELLETGANLGFAGGCNVGIRHALEAEPTPAWIWLLNNDTRVSPDCLTHMMAAAEQNPRAGILGGPILEEGRAGHMQAWGGGWVHPLLGMSWHTLRKEESHEAPLWQRNLPLLSYLQNTSATEDRRSLPWELAVQVLSLVPGRWPYLTGAHLLLRREMLEEVGLLDDGFFFTWEDCDLCIRAQQAGWSLHVVEEAPIWHKVSASSGRKSPMRVRLQTQAQIRFSRKHARWPGFASLLYTSEEGVRLLWGRKWDSFRALLEGWKKGWEEPL